jgi:hypothetical protein
LLVANNGTDSPTCGGSTSPCRTISRAISRAAAGDKIVVGPGRYGDVNRDGTLAGADEESSGASWNMIVIDKRLTVNSRDGAGATILDGGPISGSGGNTFTLVSIEADGVSFGLKGKGFTLVTTGTRVSGVSVAFGTGGAKLAGVVTEGFDRSDIEVNGVKNSVKNSVVTGTLELLGFNHTVSGNLAEGGTFQTDSTAMNMVISNNQAILSADAFDLQGMDHTISGNLASQASGNGFLCSGTCTGVQLSRNVARSAGAAGFQITRGTNHVLSRNSAGGNAGRGFNFAPSAGTAMAVTLTGNESAANTQEGFAFSSDAQPLMTGNISTGNHNEGIQLAGPGTGSTIGLINKNTIYGNDVSGNCGIRLTTADSINATGNYWGAASGAGIDPADATCLPTGGTIDAGSPATTEFMYKGPKVP